MVVASFNVNGALQQHWKPNYKPHSISFLRIPGTLCRPGSPGHYGIKNSILCFSKLELVPGYVPAQRFVAATERLRLGLFALFRRRGDQTQLFRSLSEAM
jgi:hypothetical protein